MRSCRDGDGLITEIADAGGVVSRIRSAAAR